MGVISDAWSDMNRLVLGTAQLGMRYGVANTTGRPSSPDARKLVKVAWQAGIRHFDTAQAYGDSEAVLADCLSTIGGQADARIVTKLSPHLDYLQSGSLEASAKESLKRLGVPRLAALLLHDENLLSGWESGIRPALTALSTAGLAEVGGASLYTPERALHALTLPGCGAIQIPANVFDRRFESHGVFEAAKHRGVQVYVRSVFLQGLLLLEPHELPPGLVMAQEPLIRFREICRRLGSSPRAAALGYIRERHPEARVLFGAETVEQVRQNLADWNTRTPGVVFALESAFSEPLPEDLLNPSLWPKQGSN